MSERDARARMVADLRRSGYSEKKAEATAKAAARRHELRQRGASNADAKRIQRSESGK